MHIGLEYYLQLVQFHDFEESQEAVANSNLCQVVSDSSMVYECYAIALSKNQIMNGRSTLEFHERLSY